MLIKYIISSIQSVAVSAHCNRTALSFQFLFFSVRGNNSQSTFFYRKRFRLKCRDSSIACVAPREPVRETVIAGFTLSYSIITTSCTKLPMVMVAAAARTILHCTKTLPYPANHRPLRLPLIKPGVLACHLKYL